MKDKSETYDLITMIDVLEYILKDEVIPTLKSIHSSLKSDGILIIQVPNLNSPECFLHMFNDFSHLNGFNEHSLSQVLIAPGFKHIYFQSFETIIGDSIKKRIKRFFREIIYFKYKLERKITENISYQLCHLYFLYCKIRNKINNLINEVFDCIIKMKKLNWYYLNNKF
jgi:predicted SAM-dependent methyltransferase